MKEQIPQYYLYGETSADEDQRFIHCETLNHRSKADELAFQPHRHAELFQLFFLSKGDVEVSLDAQSFFIKGPYIITLPTGVVHGFRYSGSTQGYILTLSEAVMANALLPLEQRWRSALMTQAWQTDVAVLNENSQLIAQIFDNIYIETIGSRPGKLAVISVLLTQIAVLLARHHFEQSADDKHTSLSAFERFHKLVEIHYQEQWPISRYCDYLGISERNLNRKCQANVGMSSSRFIQARVMQEARRLLSYTDNSVAQVGYLLGFDDPAYFSRYFKKHQGCGPSDYRAEKSAER